MQPSQVDRLLGSSLSQGVQMVPSRLDRPLRLLAATLQRVDGSQVKWQAGPHQSEDHSSPVGSVCSASASRPFLTSRSIRAWIARGARRRIHRHSNPGFFGGLFPTPLPVHRFPGGRPPLPSQVPVLSIAFNFRAARAASLFLDPFRMSAMAFRSRAGSPRLSSLPRSIQRRRPARRSATTAHSCSFTLPRYQVLRLPELSPPLTSMSPSGRAEQRESLPSPVSRGNCRTLTAA